MTLQKLLICNPYTKQVDASIAEGKQELATLNMQIALLRESIFKQNSETLDLLEREPSSNILHQLTELKKITYSPLIELLGEGLQSLDTMKTKLNLLLNNIEAKHCGIRKNTLANLATVLACIIILVLMIVFIFFKEDVNKWVNALFGTVISPSISVIAYTMMNKLFNSEQEIDKINIFGIEIDSMAKSIQKKLAGLINKSPTDAIPQPSLTHVSLHSLGEKSSSFADPVRSKFESDLPFGGAQPKDANGLPIDFAPLKHTHNPSAKLEKEMGKWYIDINTLENRIGILKEKMSETEESLNPNPSSEHFESPDPHNSSPRTSPKRTTTLSLDAPPPRSTTYYYT